MSTTQSRIAGLSPDVIIVEAPALIAGGKRDEDSRRAIAAANAAIWRVDPSIRVLHGAGINDARGRLRCDGRRGPGDRLEQRDLHRSRPGGDARGDDQVHARCME